MRSEKVREVLSFIPYDDWVLASEISSKTGISSHKVGALIREELANDVEWKSVKPHCRGMHLYRRVSHAII